MAAMEPKRSARRSDDPGAPGQSAGPPWILIGGGVAFLAALAVFLWRPAPVEEEVFSPSPPQVERPEPPAASEPPAAAAEPRPVSTAPVRKPDPDAPMPPLPVIPDMVPRPPQVIAEAYEFAGRNPDVLEFVPCFCGCESAGHRANAHCFVQSRNEDGSVAVWEPHGMGCAVCIDVARDSMQLRASGASVGDVRAAVESKYAARFPRMTPTPSPPSR